MARLFACFVIFLGVLICYLICDAVVVRMEARVMRSISVPSLSNDNWVSYIMVLEAPYRVKNDRRWLHLRASLGNECFVEWPEKGYLHVSIRINCRESNHTSYRSFHRGLFAWAKANAEHVIIVLAAQHYEDAYQAILDKATRDIEREMEKMGLY